jgi:hypothetical protein
MSCTAQAAVLIGVQGFDANADTFTNTDDITTGTSFIMGDWTTTGVNAGVFLGFPPTNFGFVTFETPPLSSTGDFTVSSPNFGTFTSTSVTSDVFDHTLDVAFTGNWDPGTFAGFSGLPPVVSATFSVALTQDGGFDTPISGSGTMSASIPLPATLPLFASGLGALGLLGWRRKRRARGIA